MLGPFNVVTLPRISHHRPRQRTGHMQSILLRSIEQVKAASNQTRRITTQRSSINKRAAHQKQLGTRTGRSARDRSSPFCQQLVLSRMLDEILTDGRSSSHLMSLDVEF